MRPKDRIPVPQNAYQKVEALICPTRIGSSVFFELDIKSPELRDFLSEKNLRFFSYVLYVCKQTVLVYPFLNDFILGGKKYSHTDLRITTAIKKDVSKAGSIALEKITLDPQDSPTDIQNKMDTRIQMIRSSNRTSFHRLINLLNRIPMSIFKIGVSIASFLDRLGILPSSLIESDPLHTSVVIANLGSVNGNGAFHHLYEWGTASVFITVGKLDSDGNVKILFTVDERISEGQQFFLALELFQSLLENPYGSP